KARGCFRTQLNRISSLREGSKRHLHLDLEREVVLLGLVKLNNKPALSGARNRFEIPGEHLFSLDAGDFTVAAQKEAYAVELTLKSSKATWRSRPGLTLIWESISAA